MRCHRLILRALLQRMGWLVGLVLVPVLIALTAKPQWSTLTVLIGWPVTVLVIGGLLGSTVASLLRNTQAALIPAYQRRVMTIAVVLGLGVWALAPLYGFLGGFSDDQKTWGGWIQLLSYGFIGLGFLASLIAPDPSNWGWAYGNSRQLYMRIGIAALAWLSPFGMIYYGAWLTQNPHSWNTNVPGIITVGLLCLLLGPLTWPVMASFARWLNAVDTPERAQSTFSTQSRAGNFGNTWGLAWMVRKLHCTNKPRIEFLQFQPNVLSLWQAWIGFPVILLVWLRQGNASVQPLVQAMLTAVYFLPVAPVFTGSLAMSKIGHILLLPGQANRSNLASKVFIRLAQLWVGGTLVAVSPLLAFAAWFDINLGWTLAMLLIAGVLAFSVDFFHTPSAPLSNQLDPIRIGTSAGLVLLMMLGKFYEPHLSVFWKSITVSVMGIAIPTILYRLGKSRWETAELGA